MSERIPQSIAKRVVFRAYLASDGVTLATGKTIAITISKNGGAFGNPAAGATNATEISSGFYYFDLGTGDTGTLGPLAWRGAEGTINDAGDVHSVVAATNAGFSALPNAAADAAGGLPISDAGGLDLDALNARIPAALSGGRMPADTQAISGSTESADRLERSTLGIVTGTCAALGTTTAVIASALSPASSVNDQFNGRIITFDKDTTTAALRGQSTDITDFVHATQTFTVTALTTAPASGDTFVIT